MKRGRDSAVIHVVVATGIASVVTQLVVIREYLSLFQGNEFVIALILFNWLVLGGFGTLLSRVFIRWGGPVSIPLLGWLSFVLAVFPAPGIHGIRILRHAVFIQGSSVGFYQTLGFILATVAPYALLVGFVLPYSLYVLRRLIPDFPGARVYIADNLGDAAGGALFAFALVYLVTPMQAVLLAGLPLIIVGLRLFSNSGRRPAVVWAVMGAVAATGGLITGAWFETASLNPASGELADYRESAYGRLVVQQDREQFTLFEDGTPVISSHNPALAEEAVHFPMAQVPGARRVLLISLQGGMLAELGKYRIETVDVVELNPEVTRFLLHYGLVRPSKNVRMIHGDARAYLDRTDLRYDAILVNLGEPGTFQANRFFTDRFYQLAKARLEPGGVLSFGMAGFDSYLGEPQRRKLSCLYNTVARNFRQVALMPGERTWFLCADHPLALDIPAQLKGLGIQTRYVGPYFHGNITRERMDGLNQLMIRTVPVNLDRAPHLMRLIFDQWFAKFAASPALFAGTLSLLSLVYLMTMGRGEFVLFSTGFMTMGAEFLVIFAFQIYYGYIYLQIGLIVTVFLAGLLPGAWVGERLRQRGARLLMATDLFLMVLLGLMILAIYTVGHHLPVSFFLVFGFAVAMTCGCQFPVVLHWMGGDAVAASKSFSADLMGAACGSLLTSVLLMPYFGLVGTALGLGAVKLISLAWVGGKRDLY